MFTIAGEYPHVSHTFKKNWPTLYDQLAIAHNTPVTSEQATIIVQTLCPRIPLYFRGHKGLMHYGPYYITLPATEHPPRQDGIPRLRLGVVLHECAHVKTHQAHPTAKPHGFEFCQTLARFVKRYSVFVNTKIIVDNHF